MIYELCTSIEACDPDTFPMEAVASDFLENMDSLLWSEPDFRGMYQLYLTQKMQSDVKWTVDKIGEMSRQWESSIVNNSAVQSEYPSFITPRMIDQCSKYIKRPTLVQDLMNRLLEKQSILVWSIGGVGKTELVKELISTIQSVPCEETGISEIAWIKYNPSGLLDSIHDAFSDEMDWIQFQKMCERKRERLLVVIDDVEKVDDPYLCQLSLPCRLIVTSRVRELPALVHWPLPELTADEQKQLFYWHCPMDNPQERWLDEILALTSNHTVTIEFLAKIAYYNDWSLLELYQKLVMLGFRLSEERVSSVHEKLQKEETVITQFCKLFQLLSYTEEERKLLVYASVLPNMPYTVDQAKRWFDCMQLSLLNKLYQVGMLESSRKNGRLVYWMHSVIAAAVRLDSALEVNKQAWSAYKQCESNLELKAIIVENFAEIYAGFQDLRAIEYYETLKKMVVGYIDRVHFTLSEAQLYILTDKTEQADALLRSLITDLEEGMEYPYELACCYGYMSQITEGDEKEGFKVKILNLLEYMDDEEAELIEQQFFD